MEYTYASQLLNKSCSTQVRRLATQWFLCYSWVYLLVQSFELPMPPWQYDGQVPLDLDSSTCNKAKVKHSLQWRHNDHDSVSNHQPRGCLLNRLFRRRSKKTSKLCVTGLCVGNSPIRGEFTGPVTRKIFPFDDIIMLSQQNTVLKIRAVLHARDL